MMKPDMSCLDEDNQIVFIADAKWKLLNSEERKLGISQADLYQMLSYASAYHCDRLFLIYPRQSGITDRIELQYLCNEVQLWIVPWDLSASLQRKGSVVASRKMRKAFFGGKPDH